MITQDQKKLHAAIAFGLDKPKKPAPVLPDIDFEGKLVKSNRGYYKCPYGCHNSGYPMPKWKTEKGFRGHMAKCKNSPSNVKANMLKMKEKNESRNRLVQACLDSGLIPYKIGDKIYYHSYHVTKPTHQQKWNRMVRVRYEEERRYYHQEDTIRTIDIQIPYYNSEESVEYLIKNYLVINGRVRLSDICTTLNEAKDIAISQQIAYDKSCEDAARCR